jgi:hypothetical protein
MASESAPKADASFSESGAGGMEVNTGGGKADFKPDTGLGIEAGMQIGERSGNLGMRNKQEDEKDVSKGVTDAGTDGGDQEKAPEGGEAAVADAGTGEPVPLNAPSEFNPEDTENVAAWSKEYLTEDGEYNTERFAKELDANLSKEGGKPELNAATYDFMKSRGVSRATLDTIIANELNARAQRDTSARESDAKLFETAGKVLDTKLDGADILNEAVRWGETNYTKDQRERYMKALDGTQAEKEEAVELLLNRYGKTEAFKAAESARREAERESTRRTEPLRDVTAQGTNLARGAKPFASPQEWRDARKAAGDNHEAQKAVYARAQASGFA